MFKGRIYNPETKGYSFYVPLDELESFKDRLTKLEDRMNARGKECKQHKEEIEKTNEELEINNLESVKKFIEVEGLNLNAPMNKRRASLFLIACYFCSEVEVLEYLLDQNVEINRVDMLGFNALMSLILNEHMFEDDKLEMIKLLIAKGIDIDWQNIEGKSAITQAFETMQLDICHMLLDYEAYIG